MEYFICVDIGGTSVKYGVLNGDGKFLADGETGTEAQRGGSFIIEKVCGIVENYLRDYQASGICISTAGMVDVANGSILHAAPHLIPDYTGMRVKEIMEERFHLPCEVENDVNCAGLAESFYGASRGASVSLCLTIGTGIGGAIIIGNRVFHGYSGSACEVGYMHMKGSSFQELGASRILTRTVEEMKGQKPGTLNGKKVFAMAKAKDPDCLKAIDDMVDSLGMGIANICYVLNPQVVVLGGGIMAQKEFLYKHVRRSMDRYLLPAVAKNTRLSFAENGNQAGMLGAYCHFKNMRSL